jgi:hypothetical protein
LKGYRDVQGGEEVFTAQGKFFLEPVIPKESLKLWSDAKKMHENCGTEGLMYL